MFLNISLSFFQGSEVPKLCKTFYCEVLKYSPDGIKTVSKHHFNPIGTIFVGKDSIKNLDLSFLHHWERINFTHIRDCKGLKRVVYPSSLKEVNGGLLMNCYDVGRNSYIK